MNSKNIALEKHFEKDIIQFLDEKAKSTNSNYTDRTKDYKDALKRHDITNAIEILKQLVKEYNQLTSSDIYKELTLNKIQDMVKITSYYLDKTTWNNSLGKIIKKMKENDQLNEKDIKITVFDEQEKEREKKEKLRTDKDYKLKSELDGKFEEESKNIFLYIKKKDLKQAYTSYRKMRLYFDQYPGRFESDKQDYYNDLLAHYIQLKKLRDELKNKKNKPDNYGFDVTTPTDKKNYLKVNYINTIIENIKEDVRKGNFTSARQKVIDLKHKVSKIPDSYSRLKRVLETKINIVNQRIEMAKNMNELKGEKVKNGTKP
ncbi:MAG: hypothetical protein ACMXX9_03435 [Candidatus Woesearchaeota archaeon]